MPRRKLRPGSTDDYGRTHGTQRRDADDDDDKDDDNNYDNNNNHSNSSINNYNA